MNNLSSKEKLLIGIVALIAIICGYYLLVLKPIYNKIDAQNKTIVVYNSKIIELSNLAIKNKKDQSILDALKAKSLVITLQLPKVEKNPQIAFDIKSSADNYGLSIKDMNFTTPSQYGLDSATTTGATTTDAVTKANKLLFANLLVVPVRITILGGYNNIKNFIQEVETQSRIAIIKSVDLTALQVSTAAATTANTPTTATTANTATVTSMVNKINSIITSKVSSKKSNIKNIILLNDLQPKATTTKTKAATTSKTAVPNTNSAAAASNQVQAVIEINYYYVLSGANIGEYNFNTGTYGKIDIFN